MAMSKSQVHFADIPGWRLDDRVQLRSALVRLNRSRAKGPIQVGLPRVFAAMFGNCQTKEIVPRIQQDKSDASSHFQYFPSHPPLERTYAVGQAAADGPELLFAISTQGTVASSRMKRAQPL
jgi:hypothetical protein